MGLFYACLKCANSSIYIITFVNREVADEWRRMVSTPPSKYAGHVQRVSPQFYLQKGGNLVIYCLGPSSYEMPNASQFFGKMFFVHAPEPTFIARTEITDHIHGRWYFIRSKADPFSHWYLRTSGACLVCENSNCGTIHISSEYRTRFCVRVRTPPDDSRVPEDFVMIGKDEISITAPKGYILHINDVGDLKATKGYQGETDLLFDDLRKRFITRAEKQVNGEIWECIESVERGEGEVWELVE